MKEKDIPQQKNNMEGNIENAKKNLLLNQPSEEFIQDKADWSEDISEYKRKEKNRD